jgi:GST-like protein
MFDRCQLERSRHCGIETPGLSKLCSSGCDLVVFGRKARQVLAARRGFKVAVPAMAVLVVGALGPMAGQAHHLRVYANVKDVYAIDRYERECHKLYAVLEGHLQANPGLAGPQ